MAHRQMIPLPGMFIGELWKVDELADACLRDGRYDFFLPPRGGPRQAAHAMAAAGILPDFREPDMIRLGLSPLTTSYAELWTAMDVTRSLVDG